VSRRAVLENEHVLALRRAALAALQVGATRLGKITLVLPFGAFVDLGLKGFA
jgi:ribosomal protein S1